MALDYSKLSTAELEAIANDDFTKLSNRTLRALSNEPEPKSITDNIKDFGKATASLADTGLNAVTGMLDYAAYPLARAFGRSPEQATQETSSPKDVIGRGLGITQDPAYQSELSRRMMAGVGQGIENYAVKPLASATGLPAQDIGSMLGSATIGVSPAIPKVASATVGAVQKAAPIIKAPIDIGKGLYQGMRGVEPGTQKSAVVPLRDTYYPPEMVNAYMRGDIDLPTLQAGQQPSKSLFATPEQQSALRMAERMPGEPNVPLIPVQGKSMQAFGERVGREYVTDPYRAAADIGLSVVAGLPLPLSAAQRALQARQSRTLSQAANFDPMFRQKLMQDVSQPTPTPMQAPAPGPVNPATMNYPLTVQGPGQQLPPSVMTAPDLSRRVNIEGQPFNLPSQINTTNSQTARPQPVTPQQLALEKTQQIVQQQTPKPAPVVRTQPTVKAPVEQTTIRPSNIIDKELTALDNQMTNLRDEALFNRLTPDTPEGQAYSNQLNEMGKQAAVLAKELELAKKAEKSQVRQAKKAPPNVSKMMTPEDTFKALKQDVPRSEMGLTEGKIFDMTQAERNAYRKTLTAQLNTPKLYPMDKQLIENALKLIDKYDFK